MASKSEEGAWSFPDDGVCDYSLDSEAAAAFLDASLSPMINFSHPTQQQRVPTTCSRASNTSGSDLARSTKVAPVPSPRDGAESDATSMRSSQLGTYSRPPTVPEDQDHLELGQWIVGPAIGSGESGKVRLVRHRFRSDELGALKMVRKFWPDDHKPRDIFREIDILRIVHHPHIIALKDVMESTNHLYMVTDYCECGSLFDHMRDNGILDRTEIRRYFSQLISAISHLKVLSIAHRDIKLENLFLFEDMWGVTSLKLGDLGMSTFVPSGTMLETSCGSPHYAAPEVIAGDQYDGSAADVWSSGVVLYGLIARTLPFDNDNIPTLLNLIKLGDYKMHDSIQGEARDLIRQMVMKDTSRRISVEEIQRHPFVDQSLLSKDLQDTQFAPSRAELNIEVIGSMISLLRLSTMQEVEKAILDPRVPNPARYIYLSLLNMKRNLQERGRASMLSFSTTSTTFSSLRRSPSAPGSLGKSTPASSKRLRHVVSMIDSSSGSPPESFRQGTSLSSYSTDREYSLIGDAGDLPSSKTARPVLKKRSISLLARRFSLGLRSSIDRSPRHPSSSYRNSGHSSFQTSSSTSATQPGSDTPLRPGVFQRSLRYSSLGRAMAGKAPPESPTTVVTASPLLSPEGWNHSAGVDPTDISARGKGSLPRKRSWLLGSGTRRLSSLFSGSGFQTSSSSPDLKATAMSAMSRGDETEMSPSLSPQLDAANPVRQPTPLSLAHSSNAAIFRASPSALSPRGTTLTPPSCVPPVTPRIPFAPVGRSIRANGPAPSAGSHSAPSAFSPAIIGIPPNPKASSYNWVDSQNRQSTFQPEEPYLFPSRTRSKEWLGLGIDTLDLTSLDINDRLQDENRGLKLENALLKREVEFKDVELEKALKESRMYRAKMMQASNLQDRRRPALPR
ncbi:CAMK/CAMKL protein kinase [Microbotryum lychnidis-dioicae p1A1 Lamole]|uniref:CAMK/CAMKL protein kinase n=1 Tax=Microbotryum lychnidis-dioicae (strain p1A1 Lamole / MvSl-1064) TaxID=683840 RepID=U5GZ27_USTV1|nr:CAMK/CAMKL protein kinase [Microbotryum lychnidis-dioicae p1A1 Lamole]|eukprot:KDE09536.1 CAMK/CAMKL protein kinase [Microbotryum lychnidis-dioicae p1A1 Lamole]